MQMTTAHCMQIDQLERKKLFSEREKEGEREREREREREGERDDKMS